MFRTFIAILYVLIICVGAADSASAERRLALVIGNGAYSVGPLANPIHDASLIATTLANTGFEVTEARDLGYRDFQRIVIAFGRELRAAGEGTVGLVYYAGHAVQADGENYLIPVDADLQDELDLEIQTVEVSTLMRSLEKAGNRLNMVILDACRNNPFKSVNRSGSRGLAKVDAPFGTLLAYSTAPGDVAADGSGRNSPYTAALAKAIRTPGLPVEQLFKRVRVDVMERTGNQQVPWESSSLTGDFYFLAPSPTALAPSPTETASQPANVAADIEFWKTIASSQDPAQFHAYMNAFPNGTFRELAEQRISVLETSRLEEVEAAARREREAEGRAAWEAVKDSSDPALLQTVAERFQGTIYADLARVKMQVLQETQTASLTANRGATATGGDGEMERLFWESIQNSSNKSDYEAYLDRYPQGAFAAIARGRVDNGYSPQVAALGDAQAIHPYDGQWTLRWDVVGRYWQTAWCSPQETGTAVIDVRNGKAEGKIESNKSSMARYTIDISAEGTAWVTVRVHRWAIRERQFSIELANGTGEQDLSGLNRCQMRVTLTQGAQ